ncbi:MAG: DNA repair protein RecN, partial [bacterium]
LKTVLADADEVPTLIFDEVDAGIGGSMGTVIGRKLHGLGRRSQVISITHLPQVASFADGHLRVEKVTTGGRTRVQARWLDRVERVAELARMLGGGGAAKAKGAAGTAREHAEALLKEVER